MSEEIKVLEAKKYTFDKMCSIEIDGEGCLITDVQDRDVLLEPEYAQKIAYYILQYYGPAKSD